MKKNKILFLIITVLLIVGCGQRKKENSFEMEHFLQDVTNKVIVPAIESFNSETEILHSLIANYVDVPTEVKLVETRKQWVKTALAYERAYNFNFGPSKSKFLHQAIYNWPTVPNTIENTIKDKVIDVSTMSKLSPQIKGIAALEYLLFNQELSSLNTTMVNESKRRNYLLQSALFLKKQAERLHHIWDKDGDNYANTFITNKSTGLNDSFNLLFNGLYNAANTAKVTKIGKPGGFEKSTRTSPSKVQALYSKQSLALTLESIKVIKGVFFNKNHTNISQYISSIAKDNLVNSRLETAFKDIEDAIADIEVSLPEAIELNPEKVEVLHSKLTALNIWMGVDCRSVLSIVITSTDNDGD